MKRHTLFGAVVAALLVLSGGLAQAQTPYYTEDGGQGIRLAVLAPTAIRLTKDDDYLPVFVQGSLTGHFNKYSAVTVIDRQNMDKIIAEQQLSENGNFSETDYARIGNITNAQLILAGSITKASAGYILDLGISDAETGVRKYSYPPRPFTAAQIESGEAAAAAMEDLLSQMGIALTALGKTELHKTARPETMNAGVAMSRGIAAQKSGTLVEALSYFYNAAALDPNLPELNSRLSVLQTSVQSGNFREDAKNEIQQRRAWLALLKECEDFYRGKTFTEIVYDPAIYPMGPINFKTETQDFAGSVELRPTLDAQNMLKVIANIRGGLTALGHERLKTWSPEYDEFWLWPRPYAMPEKTLFFANRDYRASEIDNITYGLSSQCANIIGVQADLINEKGKVLATSFVLLTCEFEFELPNTVKMLFYGETDNPADANAKIWTTRGSGSRSGDSRALASFQFENVNVHDITDKVTVNITHVAVDNGLNLVERDWYDSIYSGGTAASLDRKLWKVIDSGTAGKTGLIRISAGPVRNPNDLTNGYRWQRRLLTADKDEEGFSR
ncbi:hypothetical protein FACS189491_02300 [Spirochaetia bacterium]|nr:hypothetical protein FACS189491_02300 [Spirochaetia bacterium]